MDLSALPLFPLHTVLFPDGLLPLQIFEVRYLDLMKRCADSGEPFGVVCLQSGEEVRRAPRSGEDTQPAETFSEIGTLAWLQQVDRPRSGLMLVQARGGQRFRLADAQLAQHGLWSGAIALMADDTPAAVPPELAELAPRLQRALRALGGEEAGMLRHAPEGDPRWQDAGWLANRWAERLPIAAPERQRLMSLDNPLWRLELVAEWLERLERLGQRMRPH